MPGGRPRTMKMIYSPLPWRLCRNHNLGEEAVGFQSFRMRVFYVMGNRCLYKAEWIHVLGTPESERLNVTALNLCHPTASPAFQRVGFSYCDTVSGERGRG